MADIDKGVRLEKRLRDHVKNDEKEFGFQSGKSTVDAIFVLYDSGTKSLEQRRKSFS